MFYKNKNLLLVVFMFKFINSAVSTPAFDYDASYLTYKQGIADLNSQKDFINKNQEIYTQALNDLIRLKSITLKSLERFADSLKKTNTLSSSSLGLSEVVIESLAKNLPKELQDYDWSKAKGGNTRVATDLKDFIRNLVIDASDVSEIKNKIGVSLDKTVIERAFSIKGRTVDLLKSAKIRKAINDLLIKKFSKVKELVSMNSLLENKPQSLSSMEDYLTRLRSLNKSFDANISETNFFLTDAQAEYNGLISNDAVYKRSVSRDTEFDTKSRDTEFDTKILKEIKSRFKDILKVSGITDQELQKALNKFLQDNSTFTPKKFYQALNKNSLFRDVNQANRVTSIKDHFTKFIIAKNHLDKATKALAFLKEDQQTFLKEIKPMVGKLNVINNVDTSASVSKITAPVVGDSIFFPQPKKISSKPIADKKIGKLLEDQRSLDLAKQEEVKAAADLEEALKEAENKAAALETAKTAALEEALKEAAESNEAAQEKAAERLAQANKDHQEAQARLEALQRLEDEAK